MARNSTTAPRPEGIAGEARPEGVAKDNAPHAVAYRLGVMFLEEGKYNEAIPAFRKAILIKPDFVEAHCTLGLALSRQQLFPQAIAAFREAVKLAPDFGNAYYWLGETLTKSRQFPEAAAAFREAVKITPHDAEAQYGLGSALAMAGQPSDAIAAFVEARKLAPDVKAQQRITTLLKRLGYKEPAKKGNVLGEDIGESKNPAYTGQAPPPEAAVTPPLRMRDDLHIAVKQARAEVAQNVNAELAKVRATLAASRLSAAYEVLARHSDLSNPELDQAERLRRAENLLSTYARLRKVKPDFHDTGDELRAARRIQKAAYRQRQRAKEAPAVRGRPRKLHI